jgi:hypothetical protein
VGTAECDALSVVQEVFSRLNHGMRTPLSIISNILGEAESGDALCKEAQDDARLALEQTVSMLSLLSRIAEVAPLPAVVLDLGEALDGKALAVSENASVISRLELDDLTHSYRIDSGTFFYAVRSLLSYLAAHSVREAPRFVIRLSENTAGACVSILAEGAEVETPGELVDLEELCRRDKRVEAIPLLITTLILSHHQARCEIDIKTNRISVVRIFLPLPEAR